MIQIYQQLQMDISDTFEDDFMDYQQLRLSYAKLQDTNITQCYTVSRDANLLAERMSEHLAYWKKMSLEYKKQAEAIECEVSIKSSPTVSKGERMAKQDEQVLDKWKTYYDTVEFIGKLEAIVKLLVQIHFHTKEVYQLNVKKA